MRRDTTRQICHLVEKLRKPLLCGLIFRPGGAHNAAFQAQGVGLPDDFHSFCHTGKTGVQDDVPT